MIEARPLTTADLAGCLALSSAADWNQTADDWRLIIDVGQGRGFFDGPRLVATAALMPHGERFGWVCMVLVAAEARRRGHATVLMRWARDTLDRAGRVAGLDATLAGREVYRRLGFQDVYPLRRMQADAAPASGLDVPAGALRPVLEADLPALAAYDTQVFGADRGRLLAALHGRCPLLAFVAGELGNVTGFTLARDGRLATQIGPVVADDERTAQSLLSAALSRVEGPVFIDVPDCHVAILTWLGSLGFTTQRQFTRMLLGRDTPLDDPRRIFAIAGPELG